MFYVIYGTSSSVNYRFIYDDSKSAVYQCIRQLFYVLCVIISHLVGGKLQYQATCTDESVFLYLVTLKLQVLVAKSVEVN